MALRRVSMACICIVMHDLGNAAAVPSSSSSKRATRTRKKCPMPSMSTSQFVFEEELGDDGHRGYVDKVRHRTTGKTFAMKTLKADEDEEEKSISNLRVLREACFMASCRGHPSLARLYDAVCWNPVTKRHCLVTELVGPSLDMVLTQQPENPFPEHEVRRMMRQILSGAKAMHDHGIVHRNIEPENVLVGGAGGRDIIVKIAGFGQATCISEQDVPYRGLIRYMAPEVLLLGRGAFESELVDSWSIGCLMAELLTGKRLFDIRCARRPGQEYYKGYEA
jgi:cell division cycle 2-like